MKMQSSTAVSYYKNNTFFFVCLFARSLYKMLLALRTLTNIFSRRHSVCVCVCAGGGGGGGGGEALFH